MFDITKINCPKVAVDAMIQFENDKVVFIQRKYPPLGLACVGGFVDYGESCEVAIIREVFEETSLDFEIQGQLRVHSNPNRDPRGHIMTVPFWGVGVGTPKAGDDAESIVIVNRTDIMKQRFAINDHGVFALEYIFASD